MAARRPFWKWHRWKSIGFCLWPPSTCIWNLKLKFQSKLDLCSGNHVVYRQTDGQTDGRTDGRTRWIQYTPPPTLLGGGIMMVSLLMHICVTRPQWVKPCHIYTDIPALYLSICYTCNIFTCAVIPNVRIGSNPIHSYHKIIYDLNDVELHEIVSLHVSIWQ